ncbi:MAG: O-antigen ligase family protein [Geminicoccales bacterium]
MLRFAELALATFAVIILTGTNAYYFLLGVPAGVTLEELTAYEDTIRNVFLLSYVAVVVLSVIHWQKMLIGLGVVWPVVLLVVIAWLSNFWTVDAEVTFRRCIALTVTTLMGVYLFVRFDFETLLKFLTVAVTIMAVGCIIWAIAIPDYGVHADGDHAGAWRGIFFHKNTTGRVMVYGLAVIIATWIGTDLSRTFLLFAGGTVLAVIVGTTSQTTMLGTLVLGAGLIAVRMVRGNALKSVVITLVILTIAWHGLLIGVANYDLILEALGRDATLTGRTEIWQYSLQYAVERPFSGYGYDAFWNGDLSPGAQYSKYWGTPHSHNGWLEIMIALGMPAAAIMFGIIIVTMFRAIVLARYYPTTGPATLIILTCFSILTIGMSEPVFLEKHTFDWIVMVALVGIGRALTASLSSEEADQQGHHQPAFEQGHVPGQLRGSTV